MSDFHKPTKQEKLKQLIALPASSSDWEFTSVLISRPINYFILLLIGDIKFITPNLITLLGFFSFLTASVFIFTNHFILASIFLFLRLLLDDLDGMTARYRGGGSFFGSYLDKITDVFGFAIYFSVLGYMLFKQNNSLFWLYASFFSIFSLVVTGYVKWVVTSMNPTKTKNITNLNIQKLNFKNLLVLFFKLFVVNECDLFLFSIILILFGQIKWLLLLICISQSLQMLAMVIKRGSEAYALDKNET